MTSTRYSIVQCFINLTLIYTVKNINNYTVQLSTSISFYFHGILLQFNKNHRSTTDHFPIYRVFIVSNLRPIKPISALDAYEIDIPPERLWGEGEDKKNPMHNKFLMRRFSSYWFWMAFGGRGIRIGCDFVRARVHIRKHTQPIRLFDVLPIDFCRSIRTSHIRKLIAHSFRSFFFVGVLWCR